MASKTRKKARRKKALIGQTLEGEHVIPGPVPPKALRRFKVRPDPEHEERAVREYLEIQSRGERVMHLEKVATERVFSGKHEVWDVHTNIGRWWVITNPTNLYSQKDFPSIDYNLSFHIGLAARMAARQAKEAKAEPAERERLLTPWRRWEQAAEANDSAEEAEDFQAIGMRCRECLIELVQAASNVGMLQPGEQAPKRGDFIQWSEIVARTIASGSGSQEVRGYLRSVAKATWQFVNWLTHTKNAVRADAHLALAATGSTLNTFGNLLLRYEQGAPERCPSCSSYQVEVDFRPDLEGDSPCVSLCARCGWVSNLTPTTESA
jgi:hypothetical protein